MAAKARHTALILLISISPLSAQFDLNGFLTPSDTLNKQRLGYSAAAISITGATTLTSLYYLWYANYPQSGFQFNNDNRDWLQMDKLGHTMTAYYSGLSMYKTIRWTGMPKEKALWYGGLQGWVFLLAVEIFDGFSDAWGFSTGDLIANTAGAALAIGQEALWDEQKFMMKFSFSGSPYREYNPNVLGANNWQSWLKDYNGQTYWISASPGSLGWEKFPAWLCFSVGHSGMGMLTGDPELQRHNPNFNHYQHERQFLFSLDIDLTKIPIKNRFWRNFVHTLNFIKIPFPTFELQQNGQTQWHWMYF